MPPSDRSVVALRPILEDCGYTGTRLKADYDFGSVVVPFVGFATKPWDFDSACIAVMASNGDSAATARSCRGMGAPIVWVRRDDTIDWWMQHAAEPTLFATRPIREFGALVQQNRQKLDPVSVYRGKTIARVDKYKQLDFVDAGLLPLLREQAGTKLHDLVEEMIREMLRRLSNGKPSKQTLRNVLTAVFRLLAGKILKDKSVPGFAGLDLTEPSAVLSAVESHYNSGCRANISVPRKWKSALTSASSLLSSAGSFGVVSPETLAYVYERTLVTKSLRKKLGVHATPPCLVDYMVWQLYDWIREIPEDDRHVFEPACGHAPFLLSAMRLLRLEMQDSGEEKIHDYLKSHIHGVEVDDFAREIARLSLTLADIPNPNGWDLRDGDMYVSDVLMREAAKCRILLSNPPYEAFGAETKRSYQEMGQPVTANTKAAEMLLRTLPYLPLGSAFGVVVPQGVLHDEESKVVRQDLLADFDLSEVSVFADNLFEHSDHEVAVLMGRRKKPQSKPRLLRYRRVREHDMEAFKDRLAFSSERDVLQSRFAESQDADLRLPELDEVWTYLLGGRTLGELATIGQGLFHKGKVGAANIWTIHDPPRSDDALGFAKVPQDLCIFATPKLVGINLSNAAIDRLVAGAPTREPQVLLNYAPVARKPWKLKATLDEEGHAVTSRFLTIRPKPGAPIALLMWALLNSPVANAFSYCHLGKRDILVGTMRKMPFPSQWDAHAASIEQAAQQYRQLATSDGPLFNASSTADKIRLALLAMDAAVLRAYDLPPRLERQLLDLFTGIDRKGVGCGFRGYYPAGFTSYLPLHMVISDRFQRAAADTTVDRFKPGESAYVRDVLSVAAEA